MNDYIITKYDADTIFDYVDTYYELATWYIDLSGRVAVHHRFTSTTPVMEVCCFNKVANKIIMYRQGGIIRKVADKRLFVLMLLEPVMEKHLVEDATRLPTHLPFTRVGSMDRGGETYTRWYNTMRAYKALPNFIPQEAQHDSKLHV